MKGLFVLFVVGGLLLLNLSSVSCIADAEIQDSGASLDTSGETKDTGAIDETVYHLSQFDDTIDQSIEYPYLTADKVYAAVDRLHALFSDAALKNICNRTQEDERVAKYADSVVRELSSTIYYYAGSIFKIFQMMGFIRPKQSLWEFKPVSLFMDSVIQRITEAKDMADLHGSLMAAVHKYVEPRDVAAARYLASWIDFLPSESRCKPNM